MKIEFKSDDITGLNFTKINENGYRENEGNGIKELASIFECDGLRLNSHHILIDGMLFSKHHEKEVIYHLKGDFAYLHMHFELHGDNFHEAKSKFEPNIPTSAGCHSLFFYPSLYGKLHYSVTPPNSIGVEIVFSFDFLRKIFNNDLGQLEGFGLCIENNQSAIMGNGSFPVTLRMQHLLFEMINCHYNGSLKKIFIEAKVIELLALHIEQITAVCPEKELAAIKKAEIEKFYSIKELLLQNLQEPLSIIKLSRLAGINRNKLQEGFKQIFGTTIFGFISGARMEQARQYILNNKYSTLAEVAHAIGYKNHQHFTAAFKKKFGYLPKQLLERS